MARDAVESMARRWDALAQENAMHYIATEQRTWDEQAFRASGERVAAMVHAWLGPDHPRERLLEIGCGLCRTTVHFAKGFERVDGIDIARSMIEQAEATELPANLHLTVGCGATLEPFEDDRFDCVYSAQMFQHIADAEVIRSYLREVGRVLRPQGTAILHFDSRPTRMLIEMYKALPDALLPRHHRRHIRRYRRDAAELRRWMHDAELEVIDERGAGTEVHWLRVRGARG